MSAPGGRNGRAKTDDRGNSVWTFVDDEGRDVSTVRTENVLALGDELSLAQTDIQPAPIASAKAAAPAPPSAPARSVEPPPATRPPRKPLSRQELQKLSDEIVRQRQAREAAAAGKPGGAKPGK